MGATGPTLRLVHVEPSSTAALLEFVPANPGLRYTVETSPGLAVGSWTALPSENITANRSSWSCVDDAATGTSGFYRIRVSPQRPEAIDIRTDVQPRLFWDEKIRANVIHPAKADDRESFFSNVRKRTMPALYDMLDNRGVSPASLDQAGREILATGIATDVGDVFAKITDGSFFPTAMDYGPCAYLSKDTPDAFAYRAYAERYLEALFALNFDFDKITDSQDLGPREKLYAMGVLYDWLCLGSANELGREVLRQTLGPLQDGSPALIQGINDRWGFFTHPYASCGHARYANEETMRVPPGYGTFPSSGDAFRTSFFIPTHGSHLLLSNSPAAEWLYFGRRRRRSDRAIPRSLRQESRHLPALPPRQRAARDRAESAKRAKDRPPHRRRAPRRHRRVPECDKHHAPTEGQYQWGVPNVRSRRARLSPEFPGKPLASPLIASRRDSGLPNQPARLFRAVNSPPRHARLSLDSNPPTKQPPTSAIRITRTSLTKHHV